jgi:ABC-2 type transport system permease protein
VFALALPMFLLFVFQMFKIPNEIYQIKNFTPGIIVFGFGFITLFTCMLVSKDRSSSLLIRLGVSPMKPRDYILGYTLSLVPLIIIQNILFFTLAIILGLEFNIYIILTVLVSIVVGIFYIAIGVLIGSCFNEKSAPPLSSVVIQLICFTSGMYFPKEAMGKVFIVICNVLPFESSLNIVRGVMTNTGVGLRSIITFGVYTVAVVIIASLVFNKKMVSDNK